MGFSLFNPFFTPSVGLLMLLPCHSAILAMILFDSCLLGLFWTCCMLFFYLILAAQYIIIASIHAIPGFLNPFHCLRASSAHLLLFGHPRPILILHSYGSLLTLLDFLSPITISFTFGVHGLSINPLLTYFTTLGLLWPILTFHFT